MAALTIQEITSAGIVPTYGAVSASDTITPTVTDNLILHVKNGGGSPDSVVVDDPTSQNPGGAAAFNPDLTVSVTNGTEKFIELDPARFTNTSTGLITVTHSFTTSVTCAVFLVRK
jgi:hypothetical protein